MGFTGNVISTSNGAVYLEDETSNQVPALVVRDGDGDLFGGFLTGDGPPTSGTSGTGVGRTPKGAIYTDTTYGVAFINEGTEVSPYWSPLTYDQPRLWGVNTDFRDQAGVAVATTTAEAIIPGSGLRMFGDGIQDDDSGVVVQTAAEGGNVGRMTTADGAAGDLIAIGTEAGVMQPDQHQLMVVDVESTNVSAITARATFVGFVGTAADALVEPVTGGTTTATFVQDDVAGIFQDTGFTDADGLMLVGERSNAAGTQTGVTAAATLAAAATYQRFRVEVSADGTARAFVNKQYVGQLPRATAAATHATGAALDADEEYSPVYYLATQTTANISVDVRRFAAYAYRTT
jgi:hypothetical protein